MSSTGGGIVSALSGGIQDIAAILPLLGTEQCSVQVSSALTRGYLYAAAAPMSIFGSLGVVIAGFKTLVACFSFGNIEGAKILGNMGFEPQGENLSLIMVEAGKGRKNAGRYIIETRMDELVAELNIDKNRITGISHRSAAWNAKMIATTALLSAFSIAPYIYLYQATNNLNKSTIWLFPLVRATGGFITATLIQLLIQRRITTLSTQYLVKRVPLPNTDIEAGVETKKHQADACTCLLLCLLLIGLVASVVGYVGCFSVVQNSTSNIGPVSWLGLEAGLFLMRLAIWAWNPMSDDAPPLEIILELDKHELLPTCNKDNDEILQYKVLPLTRALDFLKIITSFAGLIEPFSNPGLSLYYTLTRKRASEESVEPPADIEFVHRNWDDESKDVEKHEIGEWTLYITIFDYKERTTRVYTRDNDMDIFLSTKSDAPLVDVGHFLLEVEIDTEIDPRGDPVTSDDNILDSLRKHHRSILEHIQYRLGSGDPTKPYAIENSWTMKAADTISTIQRLRKENANDWEKILENGKEEERIEESLLICDYFTHSSIERERRLLDEKRVKWFARRMEMIAEEMKERYRGMEVEYRVDKQAVEKPPTQSLEDVGQLVFMEHCLMEQLMVYEVREWEQLFWDKLKALLVRIGNDRVEVREKLTREWKADCWKRLNSKMHAAEKRLADFNYVNELDFLELLNQQWASSISQFCDGVENPDPSQSNLRGKIKFSYVETRLRLEKEIEDIEFRLKRGSELGRFDQFWDDDALFQCRYSRSKWLQLIRYYLSAPLEIYSHALKGNKNIIHVAFSHDFSDSDVKAMIRELPWVTSISRAPFGRLPAIDRDTLFIKSTDNDLITFAKEIRRKLNRDDSTYIFTDAEASSPGSDKLGDIGRVLISFIAPDPTSDKSLILRLKHSGTDDGPLEVTLGSTIELNPPSDSSITIDDITLYPTPGPGPGHLLFVPGRRNDIVIQFAAKIHGHLLHDIELLDKGGLEDPRIPKPSIARHINTRSATSTVNLYNSK